MFQKKTGLTVLAFQHVDLTQLRDRNLSHTGLPPLDVAVGGEEDELEEEVEQCLSCLEGVMGVEEGKLEEELVDKPGTTIGTKFSVLHCIRIPFLMRCGF